MSMTVAALHKRLGALIEAGHGRKPVLVNKASFHHPCEQDGTVMLDVAAVDGPKWIPWGDDDGGTKINKDGTEAGKTVVVLDGGWDEEARLILPHDPIARALSVMDDVLTDIEDWEDQTLAGAVRESQAGLRLAYPSQDDGEPAAEVVKMDTGGSWIERNRPLPIGTKLYTRTAGGRTGEPHDAERLRSLASWLGIQALQWEANGLPADNEDMRAVRGWQELVLRTAGVKTGDDDLAAWKRSVEKWRQAATNLCNHRKKNGPEVSAQWACDATTLLGAAGELLQAISTSGVLGTPAVERVDCNMCRGTGRHGIPGAHCSWCDGTGKVKRLVKPTDESGVKGPNNG
jgi:hypothetical protein